MRIFTHLALALVAALAAPTARAEAITLGCEGELKDVMAGSGRFQSVEFTLRFDSETNQLLAYSLWGHIYVPAPAQQVFGDLQGEMLVFSYPNPKKSGSTELIGLDRVSGQFRHVLANTENGRTSGVSFVLVKGKCNKATPLW